MRHFIRSIMAVAATCSLTTLTQAAPTAAPTGVSPTAAPVASGPARQISVPTLNPCTAANASLPAPQLQISSMPIPGRIPLQTTYVHLAWPAVPNAQSYTIVRRALGGAPQSGIQLAAGWVETEYWDSVPDTRYSFGYTVAAIPARGCAASSAVQVNPPYLLLNPQYSSGTHPTEAKSTITWEEMPGAIAYRIDGPLLSTMGWMLPGETFVPGKKPTPIGVLAGSPSAPYYQLSTDVPWRGVGGATYTITALYPGNFANYAQPMAALVPRLRPIITSIDPTSGIQGKTLVSITGQYLSDPSDGRPPVIYFGTDQNGKPSSGSYPATPVYVSPRQLTAYAGLSGYIAVNGGVSPVPFTSTPQMTGPPPPTQVRVPDVRNFALKDARQKLSQAGLNPKLVSGPGLDTTLVALEVPQQGALVNSGTEIDLTTYGSGTTASGISKLTLRNDLAQALSIFTLNGVTGVLTPQDNGSQLDPGATTTITFDTKAGYLVYGVNSQTCGDPNSCWTWKGGYYGDPSGPAASDSMH